MPSFRKPNLLTSSLIGAALASLVAGMVTAQVSELPPVQTPPEESGPTPGSPPSPGEAPTDPLAEGEIAPPTGVPDPAPYTVLGPDSRRAQAEAPPPEPEPEPEPEIVEVIPVEPGPPPPLPRRPRHPAAIVQALDKVTAETLRFEVAAGQPVRWKSLVFKTNVCETEAANEPLKEATAHLVVTSEPRAQPGRAAPDAAQVFRGWMFASSPGLNPFEHPVYDVWLVGCRVPLAPRPVGLPNAGEPPAGGAPEGTAARRPVQTATPTAAVRPVG